MKKIILIGAGNVATHLGLALKKEGYDIIEVWSRDMAHAQELATRLSCEAKDDISCLSSDADLYIFSVVDDALPQLLNAFPHHDKMLVHTAGSLPMSVLENKTKRFGVFYPLQTFSKHKSVDFLNIPIFIEASDPKTLCVLKEMANAISQDVNIATSEQRKYLHIAAVFACNFTNYFYAIGEKILEDNNLSFDYLRPLILETALKAQKYSPATVQTGPAIRKDEKIMDSHLSLLESQPELQKFYQEISRSIIDKLGCAFTVVCDC